MHKCSLAVRRCNVLCWGERREPSACQGVTSTTGDWSSAGGRGWGVYLRRQCTCGTGRRMVRSSQQGGKGASIRRAFAQAFVVYPSCANRSSCASRDKPGWSGFQTPPGTLRTCGR